MGCGVLIKQAKGLVRKEHPNRDQINISGKELTYLIEQPF
jgi:hypothetical protein